MSEKALVFPPAPEPLSRTPRIRGLMSPLGVMLCPAAWLDSIFPIPAMTDHRMPLHFGLSVRTFEAARV